MGKTSIEWTDASWNPIVGCEEVSPGCANCYAARLSAARLKNVPAYKGLAAINVESIMPAGDGRVRAVSATPRWTGKVRFLENRLEEPLGWKKPRRIFVCDMSDLFHESVKNEWLVKIWKVIVDAPQHTYQILTKRPARMREFVRTMMLEPLPNLWLGVSVENQHFADERIPLLLSTPAAVRFISAEPLLGPVSLNCVRDGQNFIDTVGGIRSIRPNLDWVIAGGESGPNARPMHPDWARGLRDQCQAAGVPFFFKQWGEWSFDQKLYRKLPANRVKYFEPNASCGTCLMYRVGKKLSGRMLDGREWSEFPK
jgi:protein gp37